MGRPRQEGQDLEQAPPGRTVQEPLPAPRAGEPRVTPEGGGRASAARLRRKGREPPARGDRPAPMKEQLLEELPRSLAQPVSAILTIPGAGLCVA